MKKMKKTLLSLCTLAFGTSLIAGFSVSASATEAYTPDFTIGQYASVRLGDVVEDVDKTGIRFNLFMTKEKYEAISTDGVWDEGVTVGAIVKPTSLLGENDLTTETAEIVNIPLYADMWCEATAKDLETAGITSGEYMTSYAVLYNVPSVCLDWALTAVGYIDPTTAENDTVYTDVSCERSMAQVAFAAIQAGEDADALDKYLPSYEVEFKQGENVVKSAIVKYGDKASLGNVEVTPEKGYFLTGWVDQEGNAYDFDTPVTGNLTLTAVEKSINEMLVFNNEASLDMVKAATTKEIVQDGDKKVLSATFGGNDVLKIDLGSVYNMWNDGTVGFKVYYKVEKSAASNEVEVWLNNLGGGSSPIWDKSAKIDTANGGEYSVLYLEASSAVISQADNPTFEAVLFKSTASVSIKIENIEFVTQWETWDGFMQLNDSFTGSPEYVVADFTNFLGFKQQVSRKGASTVSLTQNYGSTIAKTQWNGNYVQFAFPSPIRVGDTDYYYFYFKLLNETDVVYFEPYFLLESGTIQNYWLSESVFPNPRMTKLADGTYQLKMKVSDLGLDADTKIKGFVVSTNNVNSPAFLAIKTTVSFKNPTSSSFAWSKFNTQIGETNEYLLADYADPTWNGAVFGRGNGTVTAVRNAAGELTGFTATKCSWAAQSVVFGFEEGIEYTTVDKFYVSYSGRSGGLYAYIYDEVGNGYWAGVSKDDANGVATVTLPAVGTAADNGCKGDASVTFGGKKIVGILITSDGNATDTVTISKITYAKK